jgi:DNA-binding response OmpR family regulator
MSNIKVALIEDDINISDMYVARFNITGGFEMKVAHDGASGLELIKAFQPDVILLDMMMPLMSGIETLTRLRNLPNGGTYRVMALTNMKDDDTIAKLKLLNVNDYIVKAEMSPGIIVERTRKLAQQPVSPQYSAV